ncbi:MAG: LysM peptidoglycan-binding domain-containing protein, partial [Oscillospiraceae bacterium]|nr:LysM peptidoglycan-binding domain-containing protein [Oscillospiraceae bacterium]
MKKRLTSVLLTICMVASLFSVMGATAFADVETVEYTMKSGDNVYSICRKLGIDFQANYDWITETNKIKNYSAIPVGKKLILPLGDTTGLAPGGTTGNTGTNTGVTSGTASLQLNTGDVIASYLIPYVVSSGDTMYDICLAKGINYSDSIDSIMKINGLKNANRIAVGRTLLLPSSKAPASGSCVAVVAHKIVSGDATYNLCQGYNIDYEDNLELMKALNGKTNMASIKTGRTLLLPVPTTIVPSTSGGTTGGTTGNTGNTGNTGHS